MKADALTPDLGAAEAFLALLDPDAASWTFQTFDDTKAKRDELARVIHGTLAGCAESLARLNRLGAGIFVTVNRTDGNGRKAENITGLRALFVDEDAPLQKPVALEPSILVQADRGKHYYWKVAAGAPLAAFKPAQKHLISYYGSDPEVNDLPRVMRLPGYYHMKHAPKLATLDGGSGKVYTIEEVLGAHPVEKKAPVPKAAPKLAPPADDRVAKLERIVLDAADARSWAEGSRHASGRATATHARKLGLPDDRVAAIVTGYLASSGAEEDAPGILTWALANVSPDPDELAPRTGATPATHGNLAIAQAPDEVVEPEPDWIEIPDEDYPAPLADAAYHGLAGRIVRLVAPHLESDPASILLQLLVSFGNAVGRGPRFMVGCTPHFAVEFLGLVGDSGAARKGTSFNEVRHILSLTGDSWASTRIPESGLSSGEGVLWEIRDPIEKVIQTKGKKKADDGPTIVDPGVADKRLCCLEPELGKVLKTMQRDGNTLSGVVRSLWDCPEVVRPLVKNNQFKVTGPFVSIVSHITRQELLHLMDEVDTINGLGNRFLWAFVKRAKFLPDGGYLTDAERAPVALELRTALDRARHIKTMSRDAEAKRTWHAVYEGLNEARPGLLGALTRRGDAHTLRLSMLYALLDGSPVVKREHLLAALAVWDYCESSVRCIWGSSIGIPEADEILRALALAPEGLTRSDLRDLFNRNISGTRITKALHALGRARLIYGKKETTAGRPSERWYAGKREVTK